MTYQELADKLNGKASKRVSNNTKIVRLDEHTIAVQLDGHDILSFWDSGFVRYDSCGWRTATTKKYMNKFGPVQIFQKDFTWYFVDNSDGDIEPFFDGVTFHA